MTSALWLNQPSRLGPSRSAGGGPGQLGGPLQRNRAQGVRGSNASVRSVTLAHFLEQALNRFGSMKSGKPQT
jgi:hypothetical protein